MKPLDAVGRDRIRRLISDFRRGRGPLVYREKLALADDLESLMKQTEPRP